MREGGRSPTGTKVIAIASREKPVMLS